ncbi:phosphodiester glycosidase family protein [Flavivirga spongiicola]|uniref:Phosphodiester glycosidase family protein n=1 Tax=Flavivirga spongiicola TaxID=421621 RepID=A0ABU7XMI3_9FLAO|nr:phosphodiester glycosidase family protein [Flavivirga sp. MEBiC05379]MDO5981395.1 phosphodiester glycosidase family protein [Flavivirga sp. MEBiC05379]
MNKPSYKIIIVTFLFISCNNTSFKKLPDLGLGEPNLIQEIEHEQLAEGLNFYKIKRGKASNKDFFTLSSGVVSENNETALVNKLKHLGFSSRIVTAAELGPHGESLGNMVRVGKYHTIEDAKKDEIRLKKDSIHMAVRYTAEDGKPTSGPFRISILEIDLNRFEGNMFSELGKGEVKGKEYTSSIAKRHHAIAAINAGFFAWNDKVGIDGEPAGISIINGELVSEATNGRAALVINNNKRHRVYIAHSLRNEMKLFIKDSVFNINGINREPGKILNCGNQLESTSTIPVHDFVCGNPNEIIVFNKEFGEKSHEGVGFEFIIDEVGTVISKNNIRGGEIPSKGYLVQATGTYAKQLEKLVQNGIMVSVEIKVMSDDGEIELKEGVYAVNGGPTLLHNGTIDMSARYREGFETQFKNFKVSDEFVDKKDKASVSEEDSSNRYGFYNGWVVRRHPRTAIGITQDNKIFVVVVYGRQPKITAGASVTEMAKLMKALGCQEAFNLDGGGSSMMIVNNKKTGKSSDLEGERAVGDALIFTE